MQVRPASFSVAVDGSNFAATLDPYKIWMKQAYDTSLLWGIMAMIPMIHCLLDQWYDDSTKKRKTPARSRTWTCNPRKSHFSFSRLLSFREPRRPTGRLGKTFGRDKGKRIKDKGLADVLGQTKTNEVVPED